MSMSTALSPNAPFTTFQGAFEHLLQSLSNDGSDVDPVNDATSSGSQFGTQARGTRELLSCQFVLSDIRSRLIHREEKILNLSYAVASFLWLMTGARDPEMICFYNQHGRSFMEAGKFCCAFGTRIRKALEGDQLEHVIRCLANDRSSRRATISVFSPNDLITSPRDTPCLLALHYFIRSDTLVCVTTMRSQSAAAIMPYDVFVFTMLHEYLAIRIGVRPGDYIHSSNTLHYYADEQETVDAILDHRGRVSPQPMPAMPDVFVNELHLLLNMEEIMRLRIASDPTASVKDLFSGLSEYSRNLLAILTTGARKSNSVFSRTDDAPLPRWSF